MTLEQRTLFRERGYLLLRGAVSASHHRPVRERIQSELRRLGVGPAGQGMPETIRKLSVFQQIAELSRLLRVPELSAVVHSKKVQEAIDALAETRASVSQSQLLVSPPNQGAFRLEGLNWHTDISAPHAGRTPGIQAFVLLDDVERHGGATLILAGSHLRARDQQAERRLREALQGADDSELRARNLSIVELSGKAGDVYLMDMRVLHTPSINATKRFRMVATQRFFLSD